VRNCWPYFSECFRGHALDRCQLVAGQLDYLLVTMGHPKHK
jgi:hypothetical protein